MIRILFSFFLVNLIAGNGFGQGNSLSVDGKINIIQDPKINAVIQKHIALNEEKGTMDGYRIQISAGLKQEEIYKMKALFYKNFPDEKSYVVFHSPYFKLRVGDYRTRLEAYGSLQQVLSAFKDAFIIKDQIAMEP